MKTRASMASTRMGRRAFLKTAGAAVGVTALTWSRPASAAPASSVPIGANGDVRVAVIGVGDPGAKGGVGGRGRQLIDSLRKVGGVRIVGLCDVDEGLLRRQSSELKDLPQAPKTYRDLRRVFDDGGIDAVVVATPNHWHALATIWACQAGKDVYVEKPVSQYVWEGRQMVAAARKHGRIVQAGTQARSSPALREAFAWLGRGELGALRFARVIVYRQRSGIGKVTGEVPIPAGVDFDLWCGPVEKRPLRRSQLHYDWHWVWSTGCGEMGNNGVHHIDICRWALGLDGPPARVMSFGGRFAFADDGETPNTQVAVLDYPSAPIYCEIRSLPEKKGAAAMDSYRGTRMGVVIEYEGGYFTGAHLGGSAFDTQGRKVKEFGPVDWAVMDTGHVANFVEAVRSRKREDLKAEIGEGHQSAAACHLANISCRLGASGTLDELAGRAGQRPALAEVVTRYREHLRANEIDFSAGGQVGPWLDFDPGPAQFVGEHAARANSLLRRADRVGFEIPDLQV